MWFCLSVEVCYPTLTELATRLFEVTAFGTRLIGTQNGLRSIQLFIEGG